MAQDTVAAWHIEHANFERLLDFLDSQRELLRSGARPDFPLLLDVASYLTYFPDRYHCSREELAFGFLAEAEPPVQSITEALMQTHRTMAKMGSELHALLPKAAARPEDCDGDLVRALERYSSSFHQHIAVEEQEVLPSAARALSASQWEWVARGAPPGPDPFRRYHRRRHDPTFGSEAEERYRALMARISSRRANRPHPVAPLPAQSAPVQERVSSSTTHRPIPRSQKTAARKAHLTRQAMMLLALVLSYLQFYFLDVELRIVRLPALIVYLFS